MISVSPVPPAWRPAALSSSARLLRISSIRTCDRACASPSCGRGLHCKLVIGSVGMVTAQIVLDAGSSLDRAGRALVECDLLG